MEQRKILRTKLTCNLQILLWGVLTLLFAVLTVLELIPSPGSGIEIKETVKVSSASLSPFDAEVKEYTCAVTGIFSNDSDADIAVDALRVVIGDGETDKTLELEGFTVPARSAHEVTFNFEDGVGYDRVKEVAVTVAGQEDILPNQTSNGLAFGGVLILYLAGIVLAAWFLVQACKHRYYLQQELASRTQIL